MPGDGIEPPTRGFSIDASKITLIISIVYISLYLVCQVVCYGYWFLFAAMNQLYRV